MNEPKFPRAVPPTDSETPASAPPPVERPAPVALDDCPDDETLAAFLDGGLSADERARVEAHLGDCEDCYEAMVEAAKTRGDMPPVHISTPVRAPSPRWRRARTWYASLGIAASLFLGVRWFSEDARLARAVSQLVQAPGTPRLTIARTNPTVAWAPAPPTLRGAERPALPNSVREAVIAIDRLASNQDSASHLNALGMSALVSGQLNQSVALLRRAVSLAPTSGPVRTNLSAALFERWHRSASAEDLVGALDSAEIALRLSPRSLEAAFDKALALEALGQTKDAADAWRAYLGLDARSAWGREAQSHLDALAKVDRSISERMEQIRSGDAKVLRDLAARDPTPLYNYLEDLLVEWSANRETSLTHGLQVAEALTGAARDAALPLLVNAAQESQSWPPGRRAALVETVATRAAGLKAIDETAYLDALKALEKAAEASATARVDHLEVLTLLEHARYYAHRDLGAVSRLAGMQSSLKAAGLWRLLARTCQLRGVQLGRESKFSDAALQYAEGRDAARIAGDLDAIGALAAVSGELLITEGDLQTGWEFHRTALGTLSTLRSYRRRHTILSVAASGAERSNMPGAALALAEALANLAGAFHNPAGEAAAHLRRARAFSTLGLQGRAVEEIDAAHAAQAAIADPSLRAGYLGDVTVNEGFILRQSDPARAIRALDVALASYPVTSNYSRVAEILLSRGEAQLALGHRADAEHDWMRGIEVFEDQRAGIREDQLRISRLDRLWELFSSVVDLCRDRPAEAVDILERSRARSLLDSMDRSHSIVPLQGEALRSWLPERSVALEFSVQHNRTLVFVITRDRVELIEGAVSEVELARLVEQYLQSLRAGTSSPAGERLAALLIPTSLALQPTEPLFLLPDGPLHSLPFGTLPVRGQRLVELSVPIVSPSLTVASRLAERPWRRPQSAILIAPQPNPASGLPILRASAQEATLLRQLYPQAKTLEGPGVRGVDVLRLAASFDVVHFAGHAIVDDRYPSRSRLVTDEESADGGLTPLEIAGSHFQAQSLIILAACDTARGLSVRGEGAMSLARSFLSAGSSSVVGTLWPVPDDATAAFLVTFHHLLRAGVFPAIALAQAQRSAIGLDPTGVWSAFEFIGGFNSGV